MILINSFHLQTNNYDVDDPEILVLKNVTHADAGWYTCVASNQLGTSFANAYLRVIDSE